MTKGVTVKPSMTRNSRLRRNQQRLPFLDRRSWVTLASTMTAWLPLLLMAGGMR
jgi:hypothetical protein